MPADTTGNEGSELTFTAAATDVADGEDPLTYLWGFGDGSPIVSGVGLTSVGHTYDDDGIYTLTLTVSDGNGGSVVDTRSIQIDNVAPIVFTALAGDTTGDENTRFAFSAMASDVASVHDPLTYAWDFGDGNSVVSSVDRTIESHLYADNGDYTVTLTITDGDGGQLVQTLPVTVRNVAPLTHGLTGPAAGSEGNVLQFTGRATDQASANDPLTYRWEAFVEGTATPVASDDGVELTSFLFVPEDEGRFTIKLTVDDGDGGTTSQTWSTIVADVTVGVVTVANSNPTLRFAANQTVVEDSSYALNVLFQDAGGIDTHQAQVDWGDGSDAEPGVVDEATQRITGTHTYRQDGRYTVTVRVRDSDMPSDTWVENSFPLTVTNGVPVANAGADRTTTTGQPITLQGTFTDPGSLDMHTLRWQVSASSGEQILDGDAVDFRFTPNEVGLYVVTYTVTDDSGGQSSDVVLVDVANALPNGVNLVAPSTAVEGDLVTVQASFIGPDLGDEHHVQWELAASNGQVIKRQFGSVSADSREAVFSFTPHDNGQYTVTFTVADEHDGEASDTVTIAVNNAPPQATASATHVGNRVTVTVGDQSDPSAADTTAGFHYSFDFDNDGQFDSGDGTYAGSSGSASASFVPRHLHLSGDGSATIGVRTRIIDQDGGASEIVTTHQLDNPLPPLLAASVAAPATGSLVNVRGFTTAPGAPDVLLVVYEITGTSAARSISVSTSLLIRSSMRCRMIWSATASQSAS